MCFAPKELLDLQAYWKSKKGTPLGIVGDTSHANKGVSYHLGQDHLQSGAYSARLARDKEPHLTNAASAIDLGRLDGSLTKLREFSRWYAQQCFDGHPAYKDVREVIFWSTVRERVIGWSATAPKQWINDYGDMSHKTHTHISFFRDSEKRDKTAGFKRYPKFTPPPPVIVPPPVTGGDDVPAMSAYLPGYAVVIKKTSNIRSAPALNGSLVRNLTSPETWVVVGMVKGQVDPEGGSDQWYTRWFNGRWEYTAFSNASPSVAPASPVDLAKEKTRADNAEKAAAAARTDLAACNTKVANAKTALG